MTESATEQRRIGFVGIGKIGFSLAERLVESGYNVTAADVSEDALQRFEDVGGETADSPRSVARECDSVHVVVQNDEQAESVVYGDEGVFAGFEAAPSETDQLLITHSTLMPGTVTEFSEAAPDGVTVLDAAISSSQAISTGESTLIIGGDAAAIEEYMPVFETVATEIFQTGPVGSGLAAKLTNNAVHHAAEVATLEALKMGTEYGIERETLLEIFLASSGHTYFAENYEYFTEEIFQDYPNDPEIFSRNIRKNLSQALGLAYDLEVDVPLTGQVSQEAPRWFRELAQDAELDE